MAGKRRKIQYLQQTEIQLGSESLPISIRPDKRAKRITLRFNPWSRDVTVTLPRRVPASEGMEFAQTKKAWLQGLIDQTPKKVPFVCGAVVPFAGKPFDIVHEGGRGTAVRMEGSTLFVRGSAEFLPRRLKDWLKKYVQDVIQEKATEKAAAIEAKIRRVTVRDTRSRWGSCSHDGRLSFSWRLVFAPPEVLDYVVSHEVAHLLEMNHSKKFWQVVESLCPEWERASAWLKHNGHTLYIYG